MDYDYWDWYFAGYPPLSPKMEDTLGWMDYWNYISTALQNRLWEIHSRRSLDTEAWVQGITGIPDPDTWPNVPWEEV